MASADDLDEITCRICLEILEDPVTVPCGNKHVFCKKCLRPMLTQPVVKCILCRQDYDPKSISRSTSIIHAMRKRSGTCYGCNQKVPLNQMKAHLQSCDKIDRSIPKFHPVQTTSQQYPSNLPNRSTFQCPYCGLQNLTCSSLVDHCNEGHRGNTTAVVCPVCVSMPWGDPAIHSQNFIQHLNLRHKFEYDTYVEFNQDEDDMLQAALQASLTDS